MGDPEQRRWVWLFEHAWQPHPDTKERLRLHVPDTVIYRDGEPVLWVFTTKEGELKRKGSDKLKTLLVRDQLLQRASERAFGSGGDTRYIAVARSGHMKSQASDVTTAVLEAGAVHEMTKQAMPASLLSLQQFVPARAGSGSRFRCEATRDPKTMVLRFRIDKLCYLGALGGRDAPHPRSAEGEAAQAVLSEPPQPAFALRCVMQAFNAQLEGFVNRLVSHVEAVSHVRVISIEADFVQDGMERAWLIGAHSLTTTSFASFAASRLSIPPSSAFAPQHNQQPQQHAQQPLKQQRRASAPSQAKRPSSSKPRSSAAAGQGQGQGQGQAQGQAQGQGQGQGQRLGQGQGHGTGHGAGAQCSHGGG
jgi:hypothetical protein